MRGKSGAIAVFNRSHYVALLAAAACFAILYFGFDVKPSERQKLERSRAIQAESTSLEALVSDAKGKLNESQAATIASLEQQVAQAPDSLGRLNLLKNLSGRWYEFGNIAVAGGIAEQVAELENSDSAWSITGALFYQALATATEPALRSFTAQHAVKAFESAASLNPDNPEHRVNLALVYAENPKPENPMLAVQMLRDLEQKYPEVPAVYNALGRLAMKTNQWERAVQRFEKAYALDPANPNTPCLLSNAYANLGQTDKAAEFAKRCRQE